MQLQAQGHDPWAQGLGPWALGPVKGYSLVISNFGLAVGAGQKACFASRDLGSLILSDLGPPVAVHLYFPISHPPLIRSHPG